MSRSKVFDLWLSIIGRLSLSSCLGLCIPSSWNVTTSDSPILSSPSLFLWILMVCQFKLNWKKLDEILCLFGYNFSHHRMCNCSSRGPFIFQSKDIDASVKFRFDWLIPSLKQSKPVMGKHLTCLIFYLKISNSRPKKKKL